MSAAAPIDANPTGVTATAGPEVALAQENPLQQAPAQAEKPADGEASTSQQQQPSDETAAATPTSNNAKTSKKKNTPRRPKTRPASIKAAEEKRRLYISRVPFKVKKEDLISFFEPHDVTM